MSSSFVQYRLRLNRRTLAVCAASATCGLLDLVLTGHKTPDIFNVAICVLVSAQMGIGMQAYEIICQLESELANKETNVE